MLCVIYFFCGLCLTFNDLIMKNLFGLLVTLLLVAAVQGRKKSPLLEDDSVRIKNKAAGQLSFN